MPLPLSNLRILIPPSRPELNPLLRALERQGAQVVEWPRITVAEPESYGPMDAAIRGAAGFDWLLFAGSNCVKNFFARLAALAADREIVFARRVAAVGFGALSALKAQGVAADVYPKRHVAADVVAALEEKGSLAGKKFLLVRVAGAPPSLPGLLREKGAEVTEAAGYRVIIEAKEAASNLEPKPDAVAFANPTAVRLFLRAMRELGRDAAEYLAGVEVASVGPATTEAARGAGLTVDIASAGSQADLMKDLLARHGH